MSLSDPLTIGANTYARINQDNFGSEFYRRTATLEERVTFGHSTEKTLQYGTMPVERHMVKFRQTLFAADPDPEYWVESYFIVRVPKAYAFGSEDVVGSPVLYLNDNTALAGTVNMEKLIGFES
jgi:hypothetical protein